MSAFDDRPPLAPAFKEFVFYLVAASLVLLLAIPIAFWIEARGNVAMFPSASRTTSFDPTATTVPMTTGQSTTGQSTEVQSTEVQSTAPPLVSGASAPVVPAPATNDPPEPEYGCAAALSYLSANAAPGFQFVCPGYANGAQALTCISQAPCAPNQHMIVIADPCPAAYMNEAHNSWVLLHDMFGTPIPGGDTAIDPFGYC